MKTQIEYARSGIITPQMKTVAFDEGLEAEYIRRMVAEGKIVIPWNHVRKPARIAGIGKGLRTKVNASIGTSSDIVDYQAEVRKALAAQESGADTLMELSVGGDIIGKGKGNPKSMRSSSNCLSLATSASALTESHGGIRSCLTR